MDSYRNIKYSKLNTGFRAPTIRDYFRPIGDTFHKMNDIPTFTRQAVRRAIRRVNRGLRRPSRGLAMRVHSFKRLGAIVTLGSNGTAIDVNGVTNGPSGGVTITAVTGGNVIGTNNFGLGMSFALNQVAEFSEIKNLFDNYRIKMVKVRMDYSYNQAPGAIVSSTIGSGANSWQAASVPRIHFAPDEDTGTAPTGQGEVLANSYAKSGRLDRTIYVTVRPRCQAAVAVTSSGTVAAGGLAPASTWLDTATDAIPHSGVQAWFLDMPQGLKSGSQYQWTLTITPTYYIETKNVV